MQAYIPNLKNPTYPGQLEQVLRCTKNQHLTNDENYVNAFFVNIPLLWHLLSSKYFANLKEDLNFKLKEMPQNLKWSRLTRQMILSDNIFHRTELYEDGPLGEGTEITLSVGPDRH